MRQRTYSILLIIFGLALFLCLTIWSNKSTVIYLKVTEIVTSSTASTSRSPTTTSSYSRNQLVPNLFNYPDNLLENYPLAAFESRTTRGQVKMAVYGPHDYLSKYLLTHHTWESERLQMMQDVLTSDPDLQLFDLGCMLGVFTMVAASMGRQVVAIDANIENVKRLRKSLLLNNLQNEVQLVYNALSSHHQFIQLEVVPDNAGAPVAIPIGKNVKTKYRKSSIWVPTVTMDDLLIVTNFSRAMIKIDVQGSEGQALRGSIDFFKKIHVPVIMMEWVMMKEIAEDATWMITYMTSLGYKACTDIHGKNLLQTHYSQWPYDIIWVKKL